MPNQTVNIPWSAIVKSIFVILIVFAAALSQAETFKDADYNKALETSKSNSKQVYTIYSWSPHMVLSVKGLQELMADNEKNKNSNLIVVLDPNANLELAKKIQKENKWPDQFLNTNESTELNKKGFRVHYPSYVLVSNGKTVSPIIPGYKTKKQITEFTKEYVK